MPATSRQVFSDVLLVVVGLLVAALAYGAFTRVLRPPQTPREQARQEQAAVQGQVQLEILNGTLADGIAATTKAYLRSVGGFDVMDTGNAPRRDHDSTVVIDRVGNPEAARRIALALGLDVSRVRSDPRSELFVDATIILGADYPLLAPFKPSP